MSGGAIAAEKRTIKLSGGPLFIVDAVPRRASIVLIMADCREYEPWQAVWCASWSDGQRVDVKASCLVSLPAAEQPSWEERYERIASWAENGRSDASWWLGWWHAGIAHQRSVWYYIAAIRQNPKEHGWAWERVIAEALDGCTTESPHPALDIDFLKALPELSAHEWSNDWRTAIREAKAAGDSHRRAPPERVRLAMAYLLGQAAPSTSGNGHSVTPKKAAFLAGVTTCGLMSSREYEDYQSAPHVESGGFRRGRRAPELGAQGANSN